MHELGLCDALLKMVDGIAKDEELEGVRKITVEVGTLSGVVPHFLSDCWVVVSEGTPYEKTQFEVEVLPGMAGCMDCGAEFIADLDRLVCPKCGGKKLNPLSCTDLTLKEIEAY